MFGATRGRQPDERRGDPRRAVTLLVAGHETTATALAWAVERLTRHPDKLERLRAEVLDGREEYLTATIHETLRLRPVISIVLRNLTQPVRSAAMSCPPASRSRPASTSSTAIPTSTPSRERFLPERFLENPPGTYTWIPFGGGVRRCLGAAFAQFEMEVVLRRVGQAAPDPPGKPQARAPVPPGDHRDPAP